MALLYRERSARSNIGAFLYPTVSRNILSYHIGELSLRNQFKTRNLYGPPFGNSFKCVEPPPLPRRPTGATHPTTARNGFPVAERVFISFIRVRYARFLLCLWATLLLYTSYLRSSWRWFKKFPVSKRMLLPVWYRRGTTLMGSSSFHFSCARRCNVADPNLCVATHLDKYFFTFPTFSILVSIRTVSIVPRKPGALVSVSY